MQFLPLTSLDKQAGTLISIEHGASFVLRIPPKNSPKETVRYTAEGNTHLVIICEKESQAEVEIIFTGSTSLEVFLEDDANLKVFCFQMNDESAQIKQRTKIGARANLYCQNVTLGKQVEQNFLAEVTGEHSKSDLDWIFYSRGDEKLQLSATNVFEGREGGGEITMQGVAEQKAHVRCDGLIKIGPGGGGTDTYLTESVLMLDPTAKVDAIPGLEIKTNDVKASHSATVSRVTPEDLFYFSARGIPHSEARKMYILGFLGDLISKSTNESTRNTLLESLESKYAGIIS